MKRILLTLFLSACIFSIGKSQTTWEEYNYITKGLADDLQKGKDVKMGYRIESTGIAASVNYSGLKKVERTVTLYYFVKKATGKRVAMIVECRDSKNQIWYHCIPSSDAPQDIWNSAFKDFVNDTDWSGAYAWAFSKIISQKLL